MKLNLIILVSILSLIINLVQCKHHRKKKHHKKNIISQVNSKVTVNQIAAKINYGNSVSGVGGDCDPSTFQSAKYLAGAPKDSAGKRRCGAESTLHFQGRSITVTIAWEASGVQQNINPDGLPYFEIVQEAYVALAQGHTNGGVFDGTCTGYCPNARI